MSSGRSDHARALRAELADKVLPYWFDTAQDHEHGGYRLADDAVRGRGVAPEKQLVSQARLLWGFAHAHRKGFSTPQRSYLAAAEQGHRFLRDHFFDRRRGGYLWKTSPSGEPLGPLKLLYGQAFVIYALVELHRAGGGPEPLEQALELYRTLQRRAHDARHGGWLEHFTPGWRWIARRRAGAEVEVPGLKSANAHLHLMEALAELCDASRDPEVAKSLREAVEINRARFYPPDPGRAALRRHPDWTPVTDPRSAGLSYGHNLEFAWLLIRAQQVLGEPPAWSHFSAYLDHSLRCGFDHARGGVYEGGAGDQPATRTDKLWWVQCEMLVALALALQHRPCAAYPQALEKLIDFVWTFLVDPRDGIWLTCVAADGRPKDTRKAHDWKAGYHELRASVRLIDAFENVAPKEALAPCALPR